MLEKLPFNTERKAVIPNLVDTDAFKQNRKPIKGLRIATVCAFRKGKRIEDILSALKIIIDEKRIQDIKLTVVGNGYLNDFYQKRCHELELDNYVDFVGRKTKEEIADILNKSNVFVIASSLETFCIPGIEALASGLPIVCTKCCGPEEYIDEKCGKLVEVGDVNAIADALCQVYENITKYDINYLHKVADKYSSKSVCAIAKKIYNDILIDRNRYKK